MHWLLRWGHGRFDWSWNAWTPCAWQASSLRRAWKHGRVFFKTWSNWDHGVETNLFKVAAMGNGACGTRIFFCHHLWMSQKNRDLYLWIWKLKNRRKIVLSVCNSGLLDFKMTFFCQHVHSNSADNFCQCRTWFSPKIGSPKCEGAQLFWKNVYDQTMKINCISYFFRRLASKSGFRSVHQHHRSLSFYRMSRPMLWLGGLVQRERLRHLNFLNY